MTASPKQLSPVMNVAAFTIIIAGLIYAEAIVTQLLMAIFVTIICAQPIRWLQSKNISTGVAILIVFTSIIAVFFGFAELIGASLSSFSEQLPLYEKNLSQMGGSLQHFLQSKGIPLPTDKLAEVFDPSRIMQFTAQALGQLGGFMGNAFTIIFLVLFALMELESVAIKTKAISVGPEESRAYLKVIGDSIRHYLSIKSLTSLFTGLFIWIFLAIVGVDYAIIWGLIAFLLNYIPNIGSILAAIPAILFSMVQLGFVGVIWTTVAFVIVNVVIGNVIEPKMMGKGLGLSTFVVFFALIFWGFVLGTVGMFLSVPLTMTIKIILDLNPKTKGIAIFLGSQEEAQTILDNKN